MNKAILLVITLGLTVAFAAGIWLARELYLEFFTDSAIIRMTNFSEQEVAVELIFPSSERIEFHLDEKAYHDLQVAHTGEGSISVRINENEKILIGYVTTINTPMLISIGHDLSIEFDYIKKQGADPVGGDQ